MIFFRHLQCLSYLLQGVLSVSYTHLDVYTRQVLDDEKMQDLVESVRINGVLTPVLLRMDENEEYEMVSGHRRMHAAQLAGLTTIPAIVRELSDDDAVIAMVDEIGRAHV